VLTFGPLGRVVCTLVVVGVFVWMVLFGGLFGVAGAVAWGGWVMPRALRDIWRPAALPSTDLTRLRDETQRQREAAARQHVEHPLFGEDPPPPQRW